MTHDIHAHRLLILDFGSQYSQLIARRVREAHVYCEVHPCDVSREWVREFAADGQLSVYQHHGFWQPMDTLRDKHTLEELWSSGRPPWKNWS